MFRCNKTVPLFLLPGLTLLVLFYFFPFINGIHYSITDGTRTGTFVGLANYRNIWKNNMFLLGLRNTLILSIIGAPLLWILSFITALAFQRVQNQGLVFRSICLMPYLTPSSAILLLWCVLFDFGGPINRLFLLLGAQKVMWLDSAAIRIPVILMFVWKNLGFCSVVFLAALQSVPQALYEYATLEGASWYIKAFKIALPHILPTAYLVLLLSWINAFNIFKEVYVIAGAYPDLSVYTLQHYMNNMFNRIDFHMVTTAAYSFATIVIGLFGILFMLQRRASKLT